MAINDVSLTAGMRANLVNLQGTVNLINRTQERLSTGKKVNSALDDPTNYFVAKDHLNRASDLTARKDGMSEAIQTVKAGNAGIEGITSLINAAKGLTQSARSADSAGRSTLAAQFNTILDQIDEMAADSGYKGVNLLADKDITVDFNEDGSNTLTISGFDASTSTAGLNIADATNSWVADTDIDGAVSDLDQAMTTLRSQSSTLAANMSIVTIRQDFTTGMIATLQTGADNLTLADMNEEGANMLMLQTRQSLGTTALSLASQAAQSVLRLFG
ncbi:MAG TPA: flagellin [Thermodesulfovibrionales bacterium]|nr:flagellin [Thermodesulfovibrionales bacterium]